MRQPSIVAITSCLLLVSALAAPATASDGPDIDAAVLDGWCIANAPDDASLEACRAAAHAMLASRDGVSPAGSDDMLGDIIDGASALFIATVDQIDVSGAEDAVNEAGRVLGEAIARIDPAGAAAEAGRLFDEAVAQVDLEGASGALEEAARLAQAVEDWVRENPDVICGLGAEGTGYAARAGANMLTGDPYLSHVAFEAAQGAVAQFCPEPD